MLIRNPVLSRWSATLSNPYFESMASLSSDSWSRSSDVSSLKYNFNLFYFDMKMQIFRD
jgi:hypothetical protein